MKTPFSRRQLIHGAGAAAGFAAASRLTGSGLFTGVANAQVAAEKSAVLVIYLNGGYNSVFPSADSYRAAGTFGITGDNTMKALANGLVVDAATFGTLPQYALDHMASVGVRHGITAHGAAQNANFGDGSRSYALRLASAMGGDAAIKAVQSGNRATPGPKAAESGVSLQTITDMKATIAALGGANDATIPDRAIGANSITAAKAMSGRLMAQSPGMLTQLNEGYQAGIATLQKPVQMFDYNAMATAYGMATTATAVTDFKSQIACAELMITAGANVVIANDGGWDTHGDRTAANVRNMMNTRILPPLKVFINRMMNRPDFNVSVAILGDFARSLPGSDHASAMTATVIGKYVKPGTTGKMAANVQLAAGTPSCVGLWQYLSAVSKTASMPLGANPHPSILL
ncbi:MAG: DUF1501 domain-containing protein [Archangiaceae bacterium]|nr:DUF1501 domain-containing protein [Archangiaceae bacterium]